MNIDLETDTAPHPGETVEDDPEVIPGDHRLFGDTEKLYERGLTSEFTLNNYYGWYRQDPG